MTISPSTPTINKVNLKSLYPELHEMTQSEDYKLYEKEADILLALRIKIKKIIKEKHLTQEKLAIKMGVKQPQLSRLISGKGGFSWKTLERFCIATGATIDLQG